MQFKKLADGNGMPMIGLGTSRLLGLACTEAVRSALENNYTHIDTAEAYDNEEAIGAAIAGRDREKLFITSKVWRREPLKSRDVIESCYVSLKRLGTDYLDLYLIHWPIRGTDFNEVFGAFAELQKKGFIRSIGVSNFTISHLQESLKICSNLDIKLAVNQVEYHPGLNQQELLDFCNEKQIALTAYSPVAKGNFAGQKVLEVLGNHHNKSIFQISLRWLYQKGIVAIPRSAQPAHQKANLAIFDFELSLSEMFQIDAIGNNQRLVRPEWAQFD